MSEIELNTSYEMFLLKRMWDRTLTERDILNVIEHMRSHLPPSVPEEIPDLSLDQIYEKHIRGLLLKYNGNKQKVANVLQINKKTLYNKMNCYGITYGDTVKG